jgi:hypothetical protein
MRAPHQQRTRIKVIKHHQQLRKDKAHLLELLADALENPLNPVSSSHRLSRILNARVPILLLNAEERYIYSHHHDHHLY